MVPQLAASGSRRLRRNSFPRTGNVFFLPLWGLEAGKEEVKTHCCFFGSSTFCIPRSFYPRLGKPRFITFSNLSLLLNSFFYSPSPISSLPFSLDHSFQNHPPVFSPFVFKSLLFGFLPTLSSLSLRFTYLFYYFPYILISTPAPPFALKCK